MMSSLVFSFSVMKMQGEVKAAACLSLVGLSASGLVLALWWLFVVLNVLSEGPDVLKPFRLKRFTCPDTCAK